MLNLQMQSKQNYYAYYTKVQVNKASYYIKLQLYYITLHYIMFSFSQLLSLYFII